MDCVLQRYSYGFWFRVKPKFHAQNHTFNNCHFCWSFLNFLHKDVRKEKAGENPNFVSHSCMICGITSLSPLSPLPKIPQGKTWKLVALGISPSFSTYISHVCLGGGRRFALDRTPPSRVRTKGKPRLVVAILEGLRTKEPWPSPPRSCPAGLGWRNGGRSVWNHEWIERLGVGEGL